jgi:acyl-CoA synthetase (AMP-forming)/AMP-acid ligase II
MLTDPATENVASIEVEKAVYAADPRVAEAVVVGLPHDRWGEAITAVVVPKTSTGKIQKNVVRDTHAGHYQS